MNVVCLPEMSVPKDASRIFDTTIDPLVRLRTIESGEFEDIACQWASGYLAKYEHYTNVALIGGSKDSGRDIVAYLDDSLQRFDIFQCKKYKDPLTPSVYLSEFGKLCYYTKIKKYNIPRKYFIVASNGIGQELRELIEHPEKINGLLIEKWEKYCAPKKKILENGVPLTDELRTYIEEFDFSIVSEIAPPTLLEQFAKTSWYKYHFGGGLRQRPKPNKPSEDVPQEERTMEYIKQLLVAYSQHKNISIPDIDCLKSEIGLYKHFKRQRLFFHSAQALKRFARDEFLNDDVYDDIREQVYYGVVSTCEGTYVDALKRIDTTIERAQVLPIESDKLNTITIQDRGGMCHDLVNEGEMKWVAEDETENTNI